MMLFSMCELISFSRFPRKNVYNILNHTKVFIFVGVVVAEVAETPGPSRTQSRSLEAQAQSSASGPLQHPCPLVPCSRTTPHRLAVSPWPAWGRNQVAQVPTFLKSLMTSSLIWERRTMTLFMKMSLRVAWSLLSRLVWCRTRYQQFTGERRYWSFL